MYMIYVNDVCFKYLVSRPPPGNPGGKFIDVDAVPRSELTCLCSSKGGEKKLLQSRGRDWISGDIPTRPGVGVGNQICEAHIIMCVPL